ncbi:MAG: caspase family protein, partial [Gemmatimonadota bacterium]|nr:caspase family protein [Gemmatimonadota bacterium]
MPDVQPVFHLVLIGVDSYDPVLKPLHGCVNDIDAVQGVFVDGPGFEFDGQIEVTRLVSRHDTGRGASTIEESGATRDEILDALEDLAGKVGPNDRVHIHYSGHGGQYAWKKDGRETGAWSEGLLTSDG